MANIVKITIRPGQRLEDNAQWTNRFEIHSSSADRVYTIAQHKTKGHMGCSCMGWRRHRTCKHLQALGLPGYEVPVVLTINQ